MADGDILPLSTSFATRRKVEDPRLRLIRRGIGDPGSILARGGIRHVQRDGVWTAERDPDWPADEGYEALPQWQARAVLTLLIQEGACPT